MPLSATGRFSHTREIRALHLLPAEDCYGVLHEVSLDDVGTSPHHRGKFNWDKMDYDDDIGVKTGGSSDAESGKDGGSDDGVKSDDGIRNGLCVGRDVGIQCSASGKR